MKITAQDLKDFEIIDEIIPEPLGGAHKDLDNTSEEIKKFLLKGWEEIKDQSVHELVENRYNKFRQIGEYK